MTAAASSSAGKPSSRHQRLHPGRRRLRRRAASAVGAGDDAGEQVDARPRSRCRRRRGPGRGPRSKESAAGAGGPEEVQRRAGRAAVHARPGPGSARDQVGELLLDDGAPRRPPACRSRSTVGSPPCRTAGTDGSSSWTTTLAPGTRAATAATWRGEPLGQGLGEVAAGTGVDDGAVAAGALQAGRQRPRAGRLHLERAGPARGDVVQRVEVAVQELPRPALVDARPRDQPPAGRGEVEGEVDEQGGAAADQVGARARGRAARAGAAKSGSSPTTRRTASAGSVPGSDPTPEAAPRRRGPARGRRSRRSGSRRRR